MAKYKYKTKGSVTKLDTQKYLCRIDGEIIDGGLPLKFSREVASSPRTHGPVFSSEDSAHNRASARRNEKTGRTLEKGIQLYRLWFRFLKLALELEEMNVELVTRQHTFLKSLKGQNVPASVLEKAARERAKRTSEAGLDEIFRCKVHTKIKVNRSAYKGWDLDKVLTQTFDAWWKDHSFLFEGHQPTILSSPEEWIDHPDFIYVRFDRTSQVRDVKDFLTKHLSPKIKTKRAAFTISGKNPRVNVIQNNYNALVLSLKGWGPKDIATAKENYLRRTDEVTDTRTKGDRLTVATDKEGKPLYSLLVSRQRNQGIFHLLEVCEGRFGNVMPTK